ncbi:helix-turn-helix transcriptional regulator [Roseibium sediminicola]|uniref:Helix-turn-helix transcriptional regulator n=1 Tax=Roseibium sediminicola TaxID=2933272 RepID=A0ABT0GQJ3_9HYPH|nr:helix-turn-helix transcriptional regulator [Roseibium sp. CAU 1639]MCK7611684.1 helix-turn-helix transcriptional regulator [Roseibium sp. CAU 1639]
MVVAAEKYIHLTNLAVSAALDPDRWQVFLDELGQALGTRVCTQLIGYDQLTRAAPLAYSSGYDPDILELYEKHYADKNPFAANFSKCAVGEVISTFQLCPPDALKKTEFYADLLAPLEDITGGGGAMLAYDADRMFLIGGNMRARDRDKYEDDWLSLCVGLTPVIRQSLEVNRTISGLSFEKWAAEQHFLGTGTAIFVVDPDMSIHYACAEAQLLLDRGTLVRNGFDRRLEFRSETIQQEFSAFTRFQSRGEHDIFKNWRFSDQDGQQWTCRTLALRLADLDRTPFGIFMDKSISAVLVALKPERNRVSFGDHVQRVLGLSQAEAATVLRLGDGLTPAEIAKDRQISVHTARNQIKSALSKTGSRRQSDLVRKVEQLRLQTEWPS